MALSSTPIMEGYSWYPVPALILSNLWAISSCYNNKIFAVGSNGTVLKNMNIFSEYQWTPSLGVGNAVDANTSFSPSSSQMYHLTATTQNACQTNDSVFIQVFTSFRFMPMLIEQLFVLMNLKLYGDFEWKPVVSNTTKAFRTKLL